MRYCSMCWDAAAIDGSPYCRACGIIQRRIEQAKPKKIIPGEPKTLDEDVAFLEAYNRKHGTSISYGHYRAKKEGRE